MNQMQMVESVTLLCGQWLVTVELQFHALPGRGGVTCVPCLSVCPFCFSGKHRDSE